MRIALLLVLALTMVVVTAPATAQTVYSNGAPNGNTDAWTINFGFVVSDTFTISGPVTITGLNFAAWTYPGDTLTSAEVSITSSENGGTSYFDETVNFTQGRCTSNQYGYNVCEESSTFTNDPTLARGSYWLNLQNASVPNGDPIYWDENSGPSQASENSVGTIPSEAFTLFTTGSTTTTSSSSSTTTSVPEPSSLMLFGSGILGLSGWIRRKLF